MKRYELTLERNDIFSVVLIEASNEELVTKWVDNRNRGEKIVGCRETKNQPKPSQSLIILI